MNAKKALGIVINTFNDFGVEMEPVSATDGRTALHLVLKPTKPVRMKDIESYEKDLCFALGVKEVIIHAPILGTSTIGVDIRKTTEPEPVLWKDIRESDAFDFLPTPLSFILGKNEENENFVADLATLPHMLMAGTTGSGKSVFLHSLICTLITRNAPEQLRLILIDPKRVELTLYEKIPHLLTEPITDAKKSVLALKWLMKEMDRRYNVLEQNEVMNIVEYHAKKAENALPDQKQYEDVDVETMPYIVVAIDELADLMAKYPREHEQSFISLAQMSRAVGIHLVISTQKPSVKVVSGLVKANIPARIAFQMASSQDSRSILDTKGAERLHGAGDALFLDGTMPSPLNVQTLHISEQEVRECVSTFEAVPYPNDEMQFRKPSDNDSIFGNDEYGEQDDLFDDVVEAVREAGKASTSFIQRKFGIGYARSARLIDMLENAGVIGPGDGAKPREVIEKEE